MDRLKMTDQDLKGKRVLIRADLNVPINAGIIRDDSRIHAALPSIKFALKAGAAVILMSHLGRPKEGILEDRDSLEPIAARLTFLLNKEVKLVRSWSNLMAKPGEIFLLENTRCNVGEKENADTLGQHYSALCDIFVQDAFASSHRAEASTYAVAKFAPIACSGLLLEAELKALNTVWDRPARPLVAIVAGAKISTKLTVLETLSDKVDTLIVGGGILNTFLLASGKQIGRSLAEPALVPNAQLIINKLKQRGASLPLPSDVVCTTDALTIHAKASVMQVSDITRDDIIADIGPQSTTRLVDLVKEAGTILWNGPIGVFEIPQFSAGTKKLAHAIAQSTAFSIAGGGETGAAISAYKLNQHISYISTGGGAFLEFLEGKNLPAIEILQQRAIGAL